MPGDVRILVVDDEPKICTMLQAVLQRDGYEVQTFQDAAAALDRFRASDFDVVISDLRMPGVNGFELIRQIKAIRPATPVVAVTGHGTTETAVHALQCGADDYLTKPFDIGNVRRVVETSLQQRELLARAQARAAEAPPAAARRSPAQDLVAANGRLEQRVSELMAVQEMAQVVAGELRLDALLDAALGAVASLTGARAVTILLPDVGQEALVVRARRGGERRHSVGERCRVGDGLAGWVAEHQVPLLIPAIEERPEFRAQAREEGGSFVGVPLLFQERLVGIVCCGEKMGGQPFDERDLRLLVSLAPHLAVALGNARLFESLQRGAFAALCSLTESLEFRDDYLRGHAGRVADYAARTAAELELAPGAVQTLRRAAQVHDIGRLGVSDTLLGRPGPLSESELASVREHPLRGARLLQALGFLDAELPLVRSHHERWDGTGYPDGLKGREIDPLARILAIADAFDAMTSPRPHREPMRFEQAFAELAQQAGTQFDPSLLEHFQRAIAGMA